VIPFNLPGISHFLVAAVLGYEFGIGVRNGCFCAHPYLLKLLGLSVEQEEQVRSRIASGDRSEMPGLVRISFGLYNDIAEVDALVDALSCVQRKEWKGTYVQDPASGEYRPQEWRVDFSEFGF
jgi:selenocysteine lyase/cysteine desulfurase